jgi:ATP-dependent Lon protease
MLKLKNSHIKDSLPLLPLRDIVIFPNMIVPLLVGRNKSIRAVEESQNSFARFIFLSTQKNLNVDEPKPEDIYSIGTIAEILQAFKLPDGSIKILIEGKQKAEIKKFLYDKDYFKVKAEPLSEVVRKSVNIEALRRSIQSLFETYVKLNKKVPSEAAVSTMNIEDPVQFSNIVASYLLIKISDKQKLLEIQELEKRLHLLIQILNSENEILQLEKRIMSDVKKQMERAQKDFYLQEQLKVIEKELGRQDEGFKEIEELKKKINKTRMTKEAKETAQRELERLSKMMPLTPEATVCRNYIDWLLNLPWKVRTKDKLDIKRAFSVLEEDHYGLEKPKERILEYLAVRKLSKDAKGQILCFVGPPGVGKTSLGKSIARALGRRFVRISLGGIRDEAEIRGHRRTYVGALPGRIIQSIRKAGTKNPVFLLDEVDKMSVDFRGDPTSALLEVLDPEQNHSFSDHYLEISFDLSDVMFITTSNVQDNIPLPLQDRMEIIKLPGYTDYEKLKIATIFLLPKQKKACGLKDETLEITEEAILRIIRRYTREAGVRNLERELSRICRKVARCAVEENKDIKIKITVDNLHKFLGPPRFSDDRTEKKDEVGVVRGLAWTEVGGDVMSVETSILKGKGKLMLTGKLGEVMQESAQAALSYIRSRAKSLNIAEDFYRKVDIHIHIPEGAIPKDGPSAGITMATALISSLTKKPVRRDVAMTGEITLRGHILAVGGLKSKILAAHRAGIKKVLIPKENDKDLQEIPAMIKKNLDIVLVENMDEVVKEAFLDTKNKTKVSVKRGRGENRKRIKKRQIGTYSRIHHVPASQMGT